MVRVGEVPEQQPPPYVYASLCDTALPGMRIKQYLDNLKFSKKTLLTQKSKLAVQLLLGEMGITP